MVAQAVAAIALGLIGMAGVAKLVNPEPTVGVLEAARLPSSQALARALGGIEIAAAMIGLSVGGATVGLGAILYLGFTFFTLGAVLNRVPVQSCGCFGRGDTPPSWLHVVYNAIAASALGWVAATGGSSIPWDSPTIQLAGYLAFAGIGVYASYLFLSVLPRTLALTKTP